MLFLNQNKSMFCQLTRKQIKFDFNLAFSSIQKNLKYLTILHQDNK